MARPPIDATEVLQAHTAGDTGAAQQLLPLVYDELRALAAAYMQNERADHTLQPTALVHEAWLRLIDIERIDWKGRSHFVAMAATQMRRILVDHARAHRAEKRGGGARRVTLDDDVAVTSSGTLDPLAFDEALERLARHSERQCRVAELRCFAGLDLKETAYLLDISERTARRDWRVARAWLRRELAAA